MKKLFIVGSYPSTEKQVNQLKNCIDSIIPLGWDILLVTHNPVPVEIQSLVTYYIYDKNNLKVPSNISPHVYLSTNFFDSKIYLDSHALSITISIFNGFNFAKNYGYDFCYYLESDSTFDLTDLNKLNLLSKQMELENKDMIIFNPENYIVKDCYYDNDGQFFYETLLFGAKINQFLDIFNPPKTVLEWLDNDMCYNLEACLYHKYKDKKDKCLIIPTFVHEYLNNSEINISRVGTFVCKIINNKTKPETPILLINNIDDGNTTKEVKLYLNDKLFDTVISYPNHWYFNTLSINNDILRIDVFENGLIESSNIIVLNESFFNSLTDNLSYIEFR